MINVIINSEPHYSVNKLALHAAVHEILQQYELSSSLSKIGGNIEIGISIVSDRKMHEINKKYRGIDASTNILSFALEDPITQTQLQHIPRIGFVQPPDKVIRLGDIVISYPMVEKDASLEGVTIEHEMIYLVQHGTRHLLGIHNHD
jgi:probable rRNA maturation factor